MDPVGADEGRGRVARAAAEARLDRDALVDHDRGRARGGRPRPPARRAPARPGSAGRRCRGRSRGARRRRRRSRCPPGRRGRPSACAAGGSRPRRRGPTSRRRLSFAGALTVTPVTPASASASARAGKPAGGICSGRTEGGCPSAATRGGDGGLVGTGGDQRVDQGLAPGREGRPHQRAHRGRRPGPDAAQGHQRRVDARAGNEDLAAHGAPEGRLGRQLQQHRRRAVEAAAVRRQPALHHLALGHRAPALEPRAAARGSPRRRASRSRTGGWRR